MRGGGGGSDIIIYSFYVGVITFSFWFEGGGVFKQNFENGSRSQPAPPLTLK